MSFISTPNVARLSIVGTLSSEVYVNTLWFHFPATGPNTTDMTNLATAVEGWWGTNVAPNLCANLVMSNINVLDQSSSSAPSVTITAAMAGTHADLAVPNNVAVVVSFRTANRGRGSRGRNYLGGFPEEHLVDRKSITGASAIALVNAYNALNPAIASTGWIHVVVSHFLDKQPRLFGLPQSVTAYVVDTRLDSARRRLAGRGT